MNPLKMRIDMYRKDVNIIIRPTKTNSHVQFSKGLHEKHRIQLSNLLLNLNTLSKK